MSKWYEVAITINKTYAVEVADDEDESHAKDSVKDEVFADDIDFVDCFGPIDDERIGNTKICADEVINL